MFFQWNEQRSYMDLSWGCGMFLASVFVLFNLFGQLGSCVMVLLQKKVTYACGVLFFIVVLQVCTHPSSILWYQRRKNVVHNLISWWMLQTFAYSIIWDFQFLLRNIALIGALLLLVADSYAESRSLFAGVPSLGENKPKSYLQLAGRSLIAFMFITLIRFEFSFLQVWNQPFKWNRLANAYYVFWILLQIIQTVLGSLLMALVTIGYKTKLSALILVIFLTSVNVYHNDWWNVPQHKPLRDFLKYDFFQVSLTD